LYCQNIFILILEPNFGDLSLKYPLIIILLEYAIEKSHNVFYFIWYGLFTYESCVHMSVMSRITRKWMILFEFIAN